VAESQSSRAGLGRFELRPPTSAYSATLHWDLHRSKRQKRHTGSEAQHYGRKASQLDVIAEPSFPEDESSTAVLQSFARGPETLAVSDAPHHKSAGRFGRSCGARPIQLFEGSRPWGGIYAN